MAELNTTARIPCRPLSYDRADLAQPKELIIDYKNHIAYICDENGDIVDISVDVNSIISQVLEQVKTSDVLTEIEIEIGDRLVSVEAGIIEAINRIDGLEPRVENLENEVSSLKDKTTSIDSKIDQLEKDIGDINVGGETVDLTPLENRVKAVEDSIELSNNSIESLDDNINEIEERVKTLEDSEIDTSTLTISADNVTENDNRKFVTSEEKTVIEDITANSNKRRSIFILANDDSIVWPEGSDGDICLLYEP